MRVTANFPCCDKPAHFDLAPWRTRQVFTRKHFCAADDATGTWWHVTVTEIARPMPGMDIHTATWLDLGSTEAQERFGRKRIPHRTVTA